MTHLAIVPTPTAEEPAAQSPARAALAAHLGEIATASKRHADAARRWSELEQGKATHKAALAALEAYQDAAAKALSEWASDLESAPSAKPTIDEAHLDRLAKAVRDTKAEHDAAVTAMKNIEGLQIEAGRAVHELTAKTPAHVALIMIQESADVFAEHERALEQARVAAARLWALTTRLQQDGLPGLVERVPRGFDVGLTPEQMKSAKAALFAYADALAANADAIFEA